MGDLNDHKAKLMIMLAGKKKPDDADPEEESGLGEEGLHAAMEDFLAAVKGDDSAGMAEAFRHALDVADDDGPEEMPEESDKE